MTCKKCEKTGLSILLVRPTAIGTDPEIAPQGVAALDTHPGTVKAFALPDLKGKTKYALRLLRREGYVYVFFPDEKPTGQIKPWQAYRVYDRAALIPEGEFVFQSSEFACDKKITHPHDVRTICIAEPERIARVWIGFSMNWWSDAIKAQVMENPKAAGMVEVNLTGASPAHGFAAEAELLKQHVADYALQSLAHGGLTEDATPFYPPGDVSASHAARAMAAVMQKQNEGSKGRPMVVAIPDPVGLAADLNGIRMARDKRDKEELLAPHIAWPLMTNQLLSSLKTSIEAGAMAQAKASLGGQMSQARWSEIVKATPNIRAHGYAWAPTEGTAPDGSPNGELRGPDHHARERRADSNGRAEGAAQWRSIAGQIDAKKRQSWKRQFDAQRCPVADRLALYEDDWLTAAGAPTDGYFTHHFDESDPNKRLAPTSPGAIYAGESHRIHYPQPQSKADCCERYLERLLGKPITDPGSVALRAMFANQKSVIDKVHAMLIGDADRDNENNMRDKSQDIFKAMVTAEWGPKHSWMKALVMGLCAGQLSAIAAAAFQLSISLKWPDGLTLPEKAQKFLKRLPALAVAEQTLLSAMRTAVEGGKPSIPVVIRFEWLMEEVLEYMDKNPVGYSEADRRAIRNKRVGSKIVVRQIVMLEAETGNINLIPSETPRMPAASPKTFGGLTQAKFDEQIKATDLQTYDRATVKNIKAYVTKEAIRAEAKGIRTDQLFGGAVMIVQGLGLVWSLRDLLKDLEKGDNSKLLDRFLSVADGGAGVIGGALDLRAAGLQMQMISEHGAERGMAMSRVSSSLSNLRAGAAMAGMAGGLLNMVMSFRKAVEADQNGDKAAYSAHLVAALAFGLNGAVMTLVYRNIVTRGATNLALGAIAQDVAAKLIKRGASRVFLTVIVGMEAEALALGVASVVSGAALVLLIVGVVATVWAVLAERTELQRWVARGYFGNDTDGRYKDMDRELLQYELLMELVHKPMTDQEIARVLKAHPAPPAVPRPPPKAPLDPWDRMNDGYGRSR
ncbi:T6SS effector BTH_I2691 family protein [Variovorax sp. H27-G14]|uniref:T6SS effector BTH_I2691 family protein n=1 Tax=Variovorax sp. H27-G14 TaxID=3111914 RepID=UPI0038FC217B